MFEIDDARKRLVATDTARALLEQVTEELVAAGVQNVRVAKAIIACKKELSDYHHVTEYSIRKREKRANDSAAGQKRAKAAKEEMSYACFAAVPAEAGSLHEGVRG